MAQSHHGNKSFYFFAVYWGEPLAQSVRELLACCVCNPIGVWSYSTRIKVGLRGCWQVSNVSSCDVHIGHAAIGRSHVPSGCRRSCCSSPSCTMWVIDSVWPKYMQNNTRCCKALKLSLCNTHTCCPAAEFIYNNWQTERQTWVPKAICCPRVPKVCFLKAWRILWLVKRY